MYFYIRFYKLYNYNVFIMWYFGLDFKTANEVKELWSLLIIYFSVGNMKIH